VLQSFARDDLTPVDLAPWHALQEWLELGETRVHIPYAGELTQAIPPVAVRLRRDVRQVLTLIQAHALLHRATRTVDSEGRIVAALADYVAVRGLVEPLVSAGVGATVPRTVREVVEAVQAYRKDEVTVREVADALKLDMNAAWRRVQRAVDEGYLVNREERERRPARLAVGAPMPDDAPVLPAARLLQKAVTARLVSGGEGDSLPPRSRTQSRNHPQDGVNGSDCAIAEPNGGMNDTAPIPQDEFEPGWDG
jgi:hypothetical protein